MNGVQDRAGPQMPQVPQVPSATSMGGGSSPLSGVGSGELGMLSGLMGASQGTGPASGFGGFYRESG